MDFFNHTTSWIKGELFEASLILSFGIAIAISGVFFGKSGSTPGAHSLFLPLLVVGIIYSGLGAGMLYSNNKRLTEFQERYRKSEQEFIQSEKQRVESFQYGYTISKIVASVCFPLTLLLFWFTKNPASQGIAISLSLFALAGLIIDYFSKERADIYYSTVLEALARIN